MSYIANTETECGQRYDRTSVKSLENRVGGNWWTFANRKELLIEYFLAEYQTSY